MVNFLHRDDNISLKIVVKRKVAASECVVERLRNIRLSQTQQHEP